MTAERSIDYDALTQDALRGVVRAVLIQVAKSGLPGDHHFYIAFDTQAPGVVLSRRLKEKYPEEMMIVLQHRFWDLLVTDEGFEVKLTFDGIPERLVIPFASIRIFFDPSVRYTLQFGDGQPDDTQEPTGPRRRRRDGSDADGVQRSGGERRPRARPKQRSAEGSDEDGSQANEPRPVEPAQRPQPALVARGGEPVAKPAALPVVAAPAAAPAAAPPAGVPAGHTSKPAAPSAASGEGQSGGAKVFSLDQFRKK